MIGSQEFYYPRPHQIQLYQTFKSSYVDEVRGHVEQNQYQTESGGDEGHHSRKPVREEILGAAENFFVAYQAEAARRASRAARGSFLTR